MRVPNLSPLSLSLHNRNSEQLMPRKDESWLRRRQMAVVPTLSLSPLPSFSVSEPRNKWPRGRGIRRAIYPLLGRGARPQLARAGGTEYMRRERVGDKVLVMLTSYVISLRQNWEVKYMDCLRKDLGEREILIIWSDILQSSPKLWSYGLSEASPLDIYQRPSWCLSPCCV